MVPQDQMVNQDQQDLKEVKEMLACQDNQELLGLPDQMDSQDWLVAPANQENKVFLVRLVRRVK